MGKSTATVVFVHQLSGYYAAGTKSDRGTTDIAKNVPSYLTWAFPASSNYSLNDALPDFSSNGKPVRSAR
eukprot:692308-Amphidinium_carterae.2